jgi:hypothetical protein
MSSLAERRGMPRPVICYKQGKTEQKDGTLIVNLEIMTPRTITLESHIQVLSPRTLRIVPKGCAGKLVRFEGDDSPTFLSPTGVQSV